MLSPPAGASTSVAATNGYTTASAFTTFNGVQQKTSTQGLTPAYITGAAAAPATTSYAPAGPTTTPSYTTSASLSVPVAAPTAATTSSVPAQAMSTVAPYNTQSLSA